MEPGTKLGHYEILAPLGEGGMGQVYRARDTTLDRDVAIKVLPAEFASDADVAADGQRFVMFPDTNQRQISSGTVTLVINWFDSDRSANALCFVGSGPLPGCAGPQRRNWPRSSASTSPGRSATF